MQWSRNLCRICGQTSNETCHPIYKEDLSNELEKKIKKCFKIELFQNDFKPKQLCNQCFIKLDDFHNFLVICHATDQKFDSMLIAHRQQEWRQTLAKTNDIDHHINQNDDMLIDYQSQQQKMNGAAGSVIAVNPNQISKSLDQLSCSGNVDIGNVVLPNLESCSMINEHEMLVEIVENAAGTYTDLQANLEYIGAPLYTNESTVLRHSSDYQMQQNPCSNNLVATSDSNNYNDSCQQRPLQQQTMDEQLSGPHQQHASNEIAASYQHNEINLTHFPQASNIVVHENLDSVQNNESKTVLSRHSRSSGKIGQVQKNFDCPRCDRHFKRRMTLNAHISAVHKNQRPFVCDLCKKSYAQRSDLTSHKKIHLGCYQCNFCPHSFSAPSKLQRHLRTHTKQKPFICDVDNCLRAFSDKRNLDAHKISLHSPSSTELNKFACENCAKIFKSKNRLRQHSKVHSSNCASSYVCEVCFKAYKYKCTLILHLKKHNGYFCPYCRKDCERVVKLIKHKKVCPVRCKDDNKDLT